MEQPANFTFLLPAIMTIFAIKFLVIGWFNQPVARAWGIAFLFGAIGFSAVMLPVPVIMQSLLGNAVFIVSSFYYGEALLRHFGGPRYVATRLVFSLIAYGAIIVAVVGLQNLNLELSVADIAFATLLGVPVGLVLWRAQTGIDRVLVVVAVVVVLDVLVRLLVFNVLIGTSNKLADYAVSSYAYFAQISASLLSVCLALAAMGGVVSKTIERYRNAADRDPLTGLLNRRGFDKAVAVLSPSDRAGCVVMTCDIDQFKQVNDNFGHASGDLVLAGLADFLMSRLPPHAVVARFGGEEFVVLVPAMSLNAGANLAQAVRLDFAARDWRPAGIFRPITMSIGVARSSSAQGSMLDAIARADQALYRAKADGRNQVMVDAGDDYTPGLRVVAASPEPQVSRLRTAVS